MRVRSLLAAAAALTIGASVANADFVVTFTRAASTANPGFDVIKLFALNNGENGTGTQLQSVDVQLTQASPAGGALKFREIDSDGDGVDDIDLFLTVPGFSVANPQGSYVRVGPPGSWNVAAAPPGLSSDPDGDGVPNTNPGTIYSSAKTVRVAGFNAVAPQANTGQGAQFAALVVPSSTPDMGGWIAEGSVAGTSGGVTNFVVPIPEPTSFALLGIGATALMGRRRRA